MSSKNGDDLTREEREFFNRRDVDGRIWTTSRDWEVVQSLQRKGLIEQNVYHGSYYWDRRHKK